MDTEYNKGYQAAVDHFVQMIDNTLSNEEVMSTLPAKWILGILRVSLLTTDEE